MAREPEYSPEDAFDAMVWMYLKAAGALRDKTLLTATYIKESADKVKPRSPVFANLDADACVMRLIAGLESR